MVEAAIEALSILFMPYHQLMLFLGILAGVVVGILPGLGGTVGMAILLPFIWDMDPHAALALLMGMTAVLRTVDTIPAVLFALPGTAGSQATIMDGYPMAKKGEAGRALGAAFTASMIGGVFGAIVLSFTLPIARPLVLALGSPEFFMLAILGITMVGVLSGRRPLKGIVCGLLGMLFATVGGAPAGYAMRYTFDVPYLFQGFPLVVVAIGIFAIPEIADLAIRGTAIADVPRLGKGIMQGVKDAFNNVFIILRCSLLGTYIGFLPGLGAAPANWLAYGHVVQTSRDKENFGKGDVRGVIGPEAANDASQGGALIPTVLFGIPGSAGMAVFLFALMILGINPGPDLVTTQLSFAFTMVWSLALGNIYASFLCMLLTKPIARITTLPVHYWIPFVLMVVILGAFQCTRSWGDLIGLLALSGLGWVMKRTAWPRPPLLIGFVLGGIAEKYLWISVMRYGAAWLARPIVIGVGLFIVVSVLMGLWWNRRRPQTVGEKGS
ncbi:MAG: tripartite tricarboxylate transporter permease [Pseudomonadota bacterium]